MKKLVMGLLGAMMILSLAACTPTTEKNKTGEVKEPQQEEVVESTADAGPGVVTGRPVDQDAPDLKMVSIYSVSEDGSKIEGTMDSVDATMAEKATLELSQFPSENQEKVLQAVANTFCENMDTETITIKAGGQTLAEGLSFADAGK